MKLRILSRLAVTVLAALTLFGCGGGGGGSSTPSGPKAIVTIGLQGTLAAGQKIGTVDVVLNLPAGVTAQADATGETLSGVVVPSGVAAGSTLSIGKYTAAVAPAVGTVRVAVVNIAGFTTGNFVTLNLDYTGSGPNLADFSTASLSVTDAANTSTQITGLTTTLALQVIH